MTISDEAKEFIELRGGDLGWTEFTEERFESVTRQYIMNQDPSLPLPKTDSSGKPLEFTNQMVEQQYAEGKSYAFVPKDGYDRILLYIHGGAYAYAIFSAHLLFLRFTGDPTSCQGGGSTIPVVLHVHL